MVDISDTKLKQMWGKPWSAWNLPVTPSEMDSVKLREAHKPKEPDKPRDQCNLLPLSLLPLYGSKPEVEYFSVTKCPACRSVMKSQWMSRHFKRDISNSLVCRRTDMIVNGNKCIGKATVPLYDIRESAKDPLSEVFSMLVGSPNKASTKIPINNSALVGNTVIPKLSPPQKHMSHKTESSTTNSSVNTNKSKSNSASSSSSSHSKKHSSSSSSTSLSSSSKHHKSSSKSLSPSSSSSWSSSKKDSSSSKSHKSHSTASYVLSIPSDDSSHSESVESILLSNSSKQTMHIITGKSKPEPEYEQLKFYADSSDKRSKASAEAAADSKAHKLHFSPQLENFKIPLKNKPSSGGNSSSNNSEASKKSKSSAVHNHSTKSTNNDSSSKISLRHSSSSSSISPSPKPVPSLTIISEAPKMNTPMMISHVVTEIKDKSSSHSKKKKKKKSRDEPRKIIPLKERAFNPDQHCGVVVSEESLPCTRSLTCKTHSIALRRAVPGRSHQFDTLLAAHKKARDEEKAKSKEIVDDSKPKVKKLNESTPVPADSDSSSSSLPQPLSVGKGNSGGKPGPSTINFKAYSLSDSTSSNNKKHGSITNVHPGSAKTVNSNPQSIRQPIAKSTATTKTTNRPVIIVDEKKEAQGLSLFDLRREPENNFIYISCIEAPKTFSNIKDMEGKTSRINALSEWNPSDRFFRKGSVGGMKKKGGFKDPLVSLLPSKLVNSTPLILLDSQGKDSSIGETGLCANDGRTMTNTALGRSNMALKRRSPEDITYVDSVVASDAKRSRLLNGCKSFHEPLLYNAVPKPEYTVRFLSCSDFDNANPENFRLTEVVAEEHEDLKSQIHLDESLSLDYDDPRNTAQTVFDSLSEEGREFLHSYLKAHGDKEFLDKATLSEEELCQHAFDLITTKFALS